MNHIYFVKFACFLSLVYIFKAKFLQTPILSEKTFYLDSKCVIPMLGQTIAEFEICKNTHVLSKIDIPKNLEANGIPNNSETNPENIKYVNLVFRVDSKKVGMFWSNASGQVFVTNPKTPVLEFAMPCSIWLRDMVTISNGFEESVPTPLEKQEAQFGNKKFIFDNSAEKVKYGYLFQDNELTALIQNREGAGLLENLITLVYHSKTLNLEELTQIPKDVDYNDL